MPWEGCRQSVLHSCTSGPVSVTWSTKHEGQGVRGEKKATFPTWRTTTYSARPVGYGGAHCLVVGLSVSVGCCSWCFAFDTDEEHF